MGDTLLSVNDLSVTYNQSAGRKREAVKHATFDLRRGEVLGIVGESGAGKPRRRALTSHLCQ